MRVSVAAFAVLMVLAGAAGAQTRRATPQTTAPLLHVQFSGPRGVAITFYQGTAPPRRFEVPVTVGLRPGYIYRIKVTGFPERPWVELHPTLEVLGTLRLNPELAGSRHPVPIYLSELDV